MNHIFEIKKSTFQIQWKVHLLWSLHTNGKFSESKGRAMTLVSLYSNRPLSVTAPKITKVTRVIPAEPSITKVTRVIQSDPVVTKVTRIVTGKFFWIHLLTFLSVFLSFLFVYWYLFVFRSSVLSQFWHQQRGSGRSVKPLTELVTAIKRLFTVRRRGLLSLIFYFFVSSSGTEYSEFTTFEGDASLDSERLTKMIQGEFD